VLATGRAPRDKYKLAYLMNKKALLGMAEGPFMSVPQSGKAGLIRGEISKQELEVIRIDSHKTANHYAYHASQILDDWMHAKMRTKSLVPF
jgi:hypothetical protein